MIINRYAKGGGLSPRIVVMAATGSTVTCTKGSTTLTAVEVGGKWTFNLNDFGIWTVSATLGDKSKTQDVDVVWAQVYEVTLLFVDATLDNNDWETIKQVADTSAGESYWAVGDTKQITINGKLSDGLTLSNYSTYVYIIGFDHNKDVEGTGIAFQGFKTAQTGGTDICLWDGGSGALLSGQWFNINNSNSNVGGWNSCLMRTITLPVVKAALPSDLTSVIKTTVLYTDNVGGGTNNASNVTATNDELYLLSEWEVSGVNNYANSAEKNYQKRYAYYTAGNSRIKYRHGSTSTAAIWWIRSTYAITQKTSAFCLISSEGENDWGTVYYSEGLAPAFKVGSNPPPQPISALAIGSSVFCNVDGVKTEFIVVHQGNPDSSTYDSSCDGTWLLKKTLCENTEKWDTNNINNFATSHMNTWLNNTYLNQIVVKDIIKKVNIPYLPGGTASAIQNMETSVFLLGLVEVGADSSTAGWSTMPVDGAKLDYFTANATDLSGARAKRKVDARPGGTAYWWLRSPVKTTTGNVWNVNPDGNFDGTFTSNSDNSSIRPAFILPFDTEIDFQGNIIID